MIEYVTRDGPPEAQLCPALVCDTCRQQATTPPGPTRAGARILWATRTSPRHETSPLYVACDYQCDRQLDADLKTRYPPGEGWTLLWDHADDVIRQLAHNLTHRFTDDPQGRYSYPARHP